MRLDERKEHILDAVVREYIRAAAPVSSGKISERAGVFGSPATIRSVMLELDEDGFLFQPYTSSGRAPTDKGYRYFVDFLMKEKDPSEDSKRDIANVIDRYEDERNLLFERLSHMLARRLNLVSGVVVPGRRERKFKYGLGEVMQEPEFMEHQTTIDFARFIDDIEDIIERQYHVRNKRANAMFDITIGEFGVVSSWADADEEGGETHIVFSAGPRRMNYEKALSLLGYVAKFL